MLVVEHQLDVIAAADWLIDLGPGGGKHGGEVVACGPPAEIMANPDSATGRALARQSQNGGTSGGESVAP